MNIKEKIRFKVKKLREQKGFSIEYLANISNVDRTYIVLTLQAVVGKN